MSTKYIVDPSDNLPAMEVGEWSPFKHELLAHYIDAARGARRKFPDRAFVDVFCGPGRICVRGTNEFKDGGAMAACRIAAVKDVAFTSVHISDMESSSVSHCSSRLTAMKVPVSELTGSAESCAPQVARKLNPYGLHLVYVDPFNMEDMPFSVFEPFLSLKHVDFLVNFSTNDLQRNLDTELSKQSSYLDKFAPGWRTHVSTQSKATMRGRFFEYWSGLFEKHGFRKPPHMPEMKNSKNAPLYRLVLFSRHDLAERLWNDISGAHDAPELF